MCRFRHPLKHPYCKFSPNHPVSCVPPQCLRTCAQYRGYPQMYWKYLFPGQSSAETRSFGKPGPGNEAMLNLSLGAVGVTKSSPVTCCDKKYRKRGMSGCKVLSPKMVWSDTAL
ncbi:hypothetical protein C8J56DRAFT_890204 [Mycena floridula]|nr:hypothetical protein C8J56DRAFT_890204 [Mycena floridula]